MATFTLEIPSAFTASAMRAPYSTPAAVSMADSLPILNFGFDDLRARMAIFTKRFDDFIEQGRKRLLEERNQFRMNLAELHDQKAQKEREITSLSSATSSLASQLAGQNAETEEMDSAISTLVSTRDGHAAHLAQLKSRLQTTRSAIATRRAVQKQHQQYLSGQTSQNRPELEMWERTLGMRIEAIGLEDRLRFVFTGVDERRPEKDSWLELDMGGVTGRHYEVVNCRPRLDPGKVEALVKDMCDKEHPGTFLKGMRELFVEEAGPPQRS